MGLETHAWTLKLFARHIGVTAMRKIELFARNRHIGVLSERP